MAGTLENVNAAPNGSQSIGLLVTDAIDEATGLNIVAQVTAQAAGDGEVIDMNNLFDGVYRRLDNITELLLRLVIKENANGL